MSDKRSSPMEKKQERVGVYVCHCGSNIAGTVDVVDVAKWAEEKLKHQGVVVSREYKFMCSSLGQELIQKDIKELGLTRVVVAACSPHLHEKTFRVAATNAGLNPKRWQRDRGAEQRLPGQDLRHRPRKACERDSSRANFTGSERKSM